MFGTIRARLSASFSACVLMIVVIGVVGVGAVRTLSSNMTETYRGNTEPILNIANFRARVLNIRITLVRSLLLQNEPGEFQKGAQAMKADEDSMKAAWNAYYPSGITSAQERAVADKINDQLTLFIASVDRVIPLLEKGNVTDASDEYKQRFLPVALALAAAATEDIEMNGRMAKRAADEAAELATQTIWLVSALAACGAILATIVATVLVRAITRPLVQAVSVANSVAAGKLDNFIQASSRDEIGQLLGALKTMSERLTETVRGIRDSSESVNVAAGQIAAGNMDLSARTEEQASSLEQTAASMTELTETVRQNADNARQANTLATNAREMTDAGSKAVEMMVETINEITSDSAKIADITGLIEGIAFQTNILALNAAVEAARAGEQGRGFAVVAGEVRALAQRASAAAKEIKDLIEVSSTKVERGAQQAGEVSMNMGKVSSAIGRVSDIVGEITAASDEQSKGIQQVHQAITQIDEVTQQNAALVEESAAAAQSLQEQSGRMKTEVAFFRTVGEAPSASRTTLSAPAKPKQAIRPKSAATSRKLTAKPVGSAPTLVPAATAGGEWETF